MNRPSSLDDLSPDLARIIPSRLADSPSRRGRGPAWQEEVRQRVRNRRRERLGNELPLFDEPEEPVVDVELEPETTAAADIVISPAAAEPEPEPLREPVTSVRAPLAFSLPKASEAPADVKDAPVPAVAEKWTLGDDVRAGVGDEDAAEPEIAPLKTSVAPPRSWIFDAPAEEEGPARAAAPLSRPAPWLDRLQAAAFDLGVLAVIWSVVVYFAGRAAQVSVDALEPVWPALAAYLGFLGFLYAVYFTGTCGRTIGKIVCGLKVVDVAGRPPGYTKAFVRVVLGTVGILAGALALVPIFFDPARRALHDRLLRMRVVKY